MSRTPASVWAAVAAHRTSLDSGPARPVVDEAAETTVPVSAATPSPKRIQLRRTKGWRKPEGAIVVARPSKWGNPWQAVPQLPRMPWAAGYDVIHRQKYSSLGNFDTETDARYWAAKGYGLHLQENRELREAAITELRGHDLACWCPLDQPCHADILLKLANPPLCPTCNGRGDISVVPEGPINAIGAPRLPCPSCSCPSCNGYGWTVAIDGARPYLNRVISCPDCQPEDAA